MITIVMATHNGGETLPRVLEAYLTLQVPEGGFKIIIVDNASNENISEIIAQFSRRLPITLLHERRRGKNIALNKAIAFVEGDLVVFTDDDAVPARDWLIVFRRTADEVPDHAVFGGAILPRWPREVPDWIKKVVPLGITYALTDPSLADGPVSPGLIYGPNMAIRRVILDAGYRFDESIGPSEGNYIMGSETEFTRRVVSAGYKSWFVSGARVEHIIRDRQLEPKWILGRAFRAGRGMYVENAKNVKAEKLLWGVPRWMRRRFIEEHIAKLVAMAKRDKEGVFRADWEIQLLRGFFYQALRYKHEE